MKTKQDTAQHTPTPWYLNVVDGSQLELFAKDEDGSTVCTALVHGPAGEWRTVGPIHEANAAFIIRAVNAHEDLLNCCKGLAETLEDEFNMLESRVDREEVIASIRRIIAKAEGR